MRIAPIFHICLLCLALAACAEAPLPEISRPRDPWVLRSVLDGRPRMVSLALHEDCYLAYDAQACALTKAWKGGLSLDGAVFTSVKTVQPTSWGTAYLEETPAPSNWHIRMNGRDTLMPIRFRGYGLVRNRVTFHYEIELANKQFAKIAERPEYETDVQGRPGLRRIFRTERMPENMEIRLHTQGRVLTLPMNDTLHLMTSFDPLPPQQKPQQTNIGDLGKLWIERSGCPTCHLENERTVGPSFREIAGKYAGDEKARDQLALKVQTGGAGNWGEVPMNPHPHIGLDELRQMTRYILSLQPAEKTRTPKGKKAKKEDLPVVVKKPGFGAPLEGLHPAYTLSTIRPAGFQPRVGGMDFLPDGRLVVCTWDSAGSVYLVEGVETGDSSQVKVKRIAAGLAEPLGLKVVGESIFVLQKQELTELRDYDGDDITDEYYSACNTFDASADFHEFSYGLVHKNGFFYANLGLAMRLMAHERQLPDRGKTVELAHYGSYRTLNFGLRQPNGIGIGPGGDLFITENQGRWVPACKLIHVKEGTFEGCRLSIRDSLPDLKMRPPAVWLPQDEIGNSPGQPVLMQDGPYRGQMLHGDVTHGGIKRTFLEQVNGEYQGCVFRFSQGLEAGVNRLVWGPDGALYVGGVGMNGGWAHKEARYGLQRMRYNGNSVFEMLAVRATADGMEIEFTEPLAAGQGETAADYLVQQWGYLPTEQYGGPKRDVETLAPAVVRLSADRKRALLEIPGLKTEQVVYIRLNENLQCAAGNGLWTSETWYTLNAIPQQ